MYYQLWGKTLGKRNILGFYIQKGYSNRTGGEGGFQGSKPMSVVKVNVFLKEKIQYAIVV